MSSKQQTTVVYLLYLIQTTHRHCYNKKRKVETFLAEVAVVSEATVAGDFDGRLCLGVGNACPLSNTLAAVLARVDVATCIHHLFSKTKAAHYEHIYSPIRQKQTEKYRHIQRDTSYSIMHYPTHSRGTGTTSYTNSFMQCDKNSPHSVITVKKSQIMHYTACIIMHYTARQR